MVQPLRLVGSFGKCNAVSSGVFGVLVLPVRSFTSVFYKIPVGNSAPSGMFGVLVLPVRSFMSVFCKVLNSKSCAHLVQIIPVLTRTCGPRGGCRWVHVLYACFMCSRNDDVIPFVFTCPFACMSLPVVRTRTCMSCTFSHNSFMRSMDDIPCAVQTCQHWLSWRKDDSVAAPARVPSFDRSFVLRHSVVHCILCVCVCTGVLQQ